MNKVKAININNKTIEKKNGLRFPNTSLKNRKVVTIQTV